MTLQAYVVAAFAALALVAGAFMTGRWTAPKPPTVVQQAEVLERIRVVATTVYRTRLVKRRTVEVITPTGTTKTTDEVEDEREAQVPPPIEKVVTLTKTLVASPPDWRVGIGAGVSLTFEPTSTNLIYTLELDRRLIGPLFAGARLQSSFSQVQPFTAAIVIGAQF